MIFETVLPNVWSRNGNQITKSTLLQWVCAVRLDGLQLTKLHLHHSSVNIQTPWKIPFVRLAWDESSAIGTLTIGYVKIFGPVANIVWRHGISIPSFSFNSPVVGVNVMLVAIWRPHPTLHESWGLWPRRSLFSYLLLSFQIKLASYSQSIKHRPEHCHGRRRQ